MSKEYYIYIYFDPSREMEPFYVGKGKGKRSQSHLKRNDKTPFPRRLNKMKKLCIEPIIEKHEGLTEIEAFDLEMQLISSAAFLNQMPQSR